MPENGFEPSGEKTILFHARKRFRAFKQEKNFILYLDNSFIY